MANREVVVKVQLENKDALRRLGELEVETKQYQRELRDLNREIAVNGKATKSQALQVGELNAKIRANQGVVRELKNDLSGLTAAGLRFRDKMAAASTEALGQFGLAAGGAVAATALFVRGVQDATRTITEFDSALGRIRALGGEYKTRIDELAEAAMTTGIQFGFAAQESAGAVEALAKAGLTVEQILGGGLTGALTLAAAGQIDLANAAETAASAMTQFGLSGADIPRVADALVGGANAAQGGVDDLREALNQSGLVASQFGLSLEETVGTLTTFASAGLLGSDAGTSFRTMLLRLAKPSKEASAEMERLGIELFDAEGNFVGIERMAGILQERLGGLTEEQRNSTLALIFGQDAVRASSLLYDAGSEKVAKYTAEVSKSGTALEVAGEQQRTLKGSLEQLGAAWDAFVLSIDKGTGVLGKSLGGIINMLSDILLFLGGDVDAGLEAFKQRLIATGEVTESVLGSKQSTAIIKGYEDQIKKIKEYGTSLSELSLQKEELAAAEAELARLEAGRGNVNFYKNREDVRIAALKVTIQAYRENISAIQDAINNEEEHTSAIVTNTEETDNNTQSVERRAAAVRVLTDELRAFLKAQQDINQGIGIGRLDVVGGIQTPQTATEQGVQPLPGSAMRADLEANVDATAELTAQYANLFLDLSTSIGQSLGDMFKDVEDTNQKVILSILETVKAGVRLWLSLTLAREVGTKSFAGIATAAVLTTLVEATFAAAKASIQGFATGGIIEGGQPIRRSNGDNVLITARVGEVILNEEQQRRLIAMLGPGAFKALGVPGFATGGTITRGTALVNMAAPTGSQLNAIEQTALLRTFDLRPVVSVKEIATVQNRVKVIEQNSSL